MSDIWAIPILKLHKIETENNKKIYIKVKSYLANKFHRLYSIYKKVTCLNTSQRPSIEK